MRRREGKGKKKTHFGKKERVFAQQRRQELHDNSKLRERLRSFLTTTSLPREEEEEENIKGGKSGHLYPGSLRLKKSKWAAHEIINARGLIITANKKGSMKGNFIVSPA